MIQSMFCILIISILVSCSLDCTIKLWSVKRGNLLFQINAPSPVTSIYIDASDKIYAACQNRLLVFGIAAHSKEADLPPAWKQKTPTAAEHEEIMNKKRSLASATNTTRVSTADYSNDVLQSMNSENHSVRNSHYQADYTTRASSKDSSHQMTRDSVNQASLVSEYMSANESDSPSKHLASSDHSAFHQNSYHHTSVAVISQSITPKTPGNPDRFAKSNTPPTKSPVSSAEDYNEEQARHRQKSAEIRRMITAVSATDQISEFLDTLMGQESFFGLDKRQLALNLEEYGIDDKTVLRLISSDEYMMIGSQRFINARYTQSTCFKR
jgi:hypothetical protein